MIFGDKLQSLRKDKKLSQEELADKLGVSRQAVSKWESGSTYPEMDKLIMLCKIFNVSLDELTNDSIKDLNVDNKQKNKIDGFIGEIVNFIDRSINMFTNISGKNIARCIVEMIILLLVLRICYKPFGYIDYLLGNIIKYLPNTIYHILDSTFYLIIMIIYLSLYLAIVVYYFDKRWLSKYENNELNLQTKNSNNIDDNKILPQNKVTIKKEKGLIRILNVLGEIFIICIKIFVLFMLIPIIIMIVIASLCLAISIILMLKGAIYVGLILSLTFGIGLLSLLMEIFFNFIFNRKTDFSRIFKIGIFSLIGLGISIGLFINEIYNVKYIDGENYNTSSYTYDMNDKLYITNGEYIVDESLTDKVKIDVLSSDYTEYYIGEDNNIISIYNYSLSNDDFKRMMDDLITDLSHKEIHSYTNNLIVKIYTSSANIAKLKSNLDNTYTDECNYTNYQNRINNLEINNNDLETKNKQLQNELTKYKQTLKDLIEE